MKKIRDEFIDDVVIEVFVSLDTILVVHPICGEGILVNGITTDYHHSSLIDLGGYRFYESSIFIIVESSILGWEC